MHGRLRYANPPRVVQISPFVLHILGQDAATIQRDAQTDDNKARLRARTEQAKALHIFVAPTFMVGDAMFWGNDRLDDAIAHAQRAAQP